MTWRAFAPKSSGGLAASAPRACPDAPPDRITRPAIRVANISRAFMVWLAQELADPLVRFEDLLQTPQVGPGIAAVHRAVIETMGEYADRANFNPLAIVVRDHPRPAVHAVDR